MPYNPATDFIALLTQTAEGIALERMPGLDYVLAAMARAGMFQLSTGQTAPTVNQAGTAWLRTSAPSWVAEGVVFLWNSATQEYEAATPALWSALLSPSVNNYSFQSAGSAAVTVLSGTSLLAIERNAPASTALLLPNLAAQFATGRKLQVIDFSSAVSNHVITLTTPDGATIMQEASWELLSTAAQLAGVTLQPSPDLSSWIIAP